jgi:hypothetical protein
MGPVVSLIFVFLAATIALGAIKIVPQGRDSPSSGSDATPAP